MRGAPAVSLRRAASRSVFGGPGGLPGGGGKIPVMPNYLVSYSDHKVILRNYEGYITTYEEPLEYRQHDKAACASCQHTRPEPGQSGRSGR